MDVLCDSQTCVMLGQGAVILAYPHRCSSSWPVSFVGKLSNLGIIMSDESHYSRLVFFSAMPKRACLKITLCVEDRSMGFS